MSKEERELNRRLRIMKHARAWLRRVTVNRAVDLIRARKSIESGRHAGGVPVPADGTSPAEREELRDRIAAALGELTEMQRSVLTAKVFDSLTFAQIAAEHDLAVPTVKTHYLRALRAVRDRLKRDWGPGDTSHE